MRLLFALCALLAAKNDLSKLPQEAWVAQVFQSLSEKERIAQLFLVATSSNKDELHDKAIEQLIQDYNIGGLVFFQGDHLHQTLLTNRYQQAAKTPLLIAMDAEWGLGMRLRDAISYPKQLTLGALQTAQGIQKMGAEIARQLKRIGVHINFAPVMDINNNPNNPVIGRRSFGENKEKVTAQSLAYMKGLQDHGILAVAKHFPGHGDTNKDSHLELPTIAHDGQRLASLELFPFKKAIEAGLGGMMTAHLHIPAYDTTPNQAASLSKKVVSDLLRQKLGFTGFIFTDALNMKAVSTHYQPGEAALLALKAGNDFLVFPENVPKAIQLIQQAIQQGEINGQEIDEKVKRILRLKYQMQLHQWKPIETQNLAKELHTPQAQLLKQQLFEQAITVVANKNDLVPLRDLDKLSIASLSIVSKARAKQVNSASETAMSDEAQPKTQAISTLFAAMLKKYAPVTPHVLLREAMTPEALEALTHALQKYPVVIVDIHDMDGRRSTNFGLKEAEFQFLKSLAATTKLIIVPFGSIYSLACFQTFDHVIAAYEEDPVAEKVVAQIIFGALSAQGKLPVRISNTWKAGWGIQTPTLQRLGYTYPEAVHMDSQVLQTIDTVVKEAITDEAMPGCQVLVARKGKVIFEKGYGHLTYDKTDPVTPATIYDLASITKVVGTLQALMYLVGEERLNVKQKLSFYMPELLGTNKRSLRIHRILAHQAGLRPYILTALKQKLLDEDGMLKKALFKPYPSATYHHQLGAHLYGATWLKELVWNCCTASQLRKKPWFSSYDYQYSCVGSYLLHRLAETLLQQPMDNFLTEQCYQPLGLTTMTYHPLHRFSQKDIAPTEEDVLLRNTLIQGTVHDPMAALYGGVAGNAGLFSNANDLAMLLQMNLQDGYYGGKRYLKKGIVKQFTTKQFKHNHRGLGWDKPTGNDQGPTSMDASMDSYGHCGFTGTMAWVDPQYDLIYIFLSNRTYPDPTNAKLAQQKIRTKVHDAVYAAIQDDKQKRKR